MDTRHSRALPFVILAVLAGVFAVDLATPRGFADWIFYLLPLVLSMRSVSRRVLILLAVTASVLTLAGFLFSPPGAPLWASGLSRVLAIVLVWITIWVVLKWRHADEKLTRLQKAVDGSNEVIFTTDAQGVITFINPAFTQTYGFTAEEVTGKTTPRILKSGQVAPETYQAFWEMLLEKRQVQGEFINKTKDGRLLTVDASASAILDARGNIAGYLGIQRDITERKHAEGVLREYEKVIEGSEDMMAVVDRDYRYRMANRAFVSHRGLERSQVLGKRVWEVLGTETFESIVKPKMDECFQGKTVHFRMKRTYPERGERDLSVAYYPIEGPAGVDRVACILQDITERLKAESELEKTQQQFLQSQKMEAVGRLAGGVAHDFNNLLTIINGYSDLMLEHAPEGSLERSHLEEIRRAGNRAATLTRQLLAFSRKQVVAPQVLDLNLVVEGARKMLRRLIGEDVQFVVNLAPDLGSIQADPGQIEQVIMNLAVNARDAMPKGGKLTLETSNTVLGEDYARSHPFVRPGRYTALAVSDTGCGMDAETLSHVFEPFFTTKERGKGTGLGLSTVYGIIKQSGGHVNVYSEPGRGTTFRVYFPRLDEPAATVASELAEVVSVQGSETVLFAEDEPGVRSLVQSALESNGYTVLAASGAEEALALAEKSSAPIHLLLTDVVMPGMNGKELADRLQSLRPGLKALFISGYTADAIAQHGILDKGVSFLPKPFTPRDLLVKVRRMLDGAKP